MALNSLRVVNTVWSQSARIRKKGKGLEQHGLNEGIRVELRDFSSHRGRNTLKNALKDERHLFHTWIRYVAVLFFFLTSFLISWNFDYFTTAANCVWKMGWLLFEIGRSVIIFKSSMLEAGMINGANQVPINWLEVSGGWREGSNFAGYRHRGWKRAPHQSWSQYRMMSTIKPISVQHCVIVLPSTRTRRFLCITNKNALMNTWADWMFLFLGLTDGHPCLIRSQLPLFRFNRLKELCSITI